MASFSNALLSRVMISCINMSLTCSTGLGLARLLNKIVVNDKWPDQLYFTSHNVHNKNNILTHIDIFVMAADRVLQKT